MPIVCIQRPNRSKPRHFTVTDAARVWCFAKKNGATEVRFVQIARENGCWDDKTSECEDLKQYLETLFNILAAILLLISLPESIFIRILLALSRFIPPRLLARLGLPKLLENLSKASRELEMVVEGLRDRIGRL